MQGTPPCEEVVRDMRVCRSGAITQRIDPMTALLGLLIVGAGLATAQSCTRDKKPKPLKMGAAALLSFGGMIAIASSDKETQEENKCLPLPSHLVVLAIPVGLNS